MVYGECLSFEQRCNKALLALRPNALRWEAPWTSLGSATRLIARNPPPLPSVARPSVQSDWALSDPRPLRQQKALEEKQEEDENLEEEEDKQEEQEEKKDEEEEKKEEEKKQEKEEKKEEKEEEEKKEEKQDKEEERPRRGLRSCAVQ